MPSATGPPSNRMELHYIGSFQRGTWFVSEDPLEEVWAHIARFGAADFVGPRMDPSVSTDGTDEVVDYAVVRVRQALEFRRAVRNTTLLTAPLPLYYSFLNLVRAFLALRTGRLATRAHGLTFVNRADLLSCGAKLTGGTFGDYLVAEAAAWAKGTVITMDDALSRIIEVWRDYVEVIRGPALATPVTVDAYIGGSVSLHLHSSYTQMGDFEQRWPLECPSLKDCCILDPDTKALRVTSLPSRTGQGEIAEFCHSHLEADLIHRMDPIWHVIRQTDPTKVLPRAAYYFIALFILASIVRYQPELMLRLAASNSQWSWLLNRLMSAAERFFPQLMLIWLHQGPLYFSGVA